MKLLQNSGKERVIDWLREWVTPGSVLDMMSPAFSLYAFAEARDLVTKASSCRVLLGDPGSIGKPFGFDGERRVGRTGHSERLLAWRRGSKGQGTRA